MEKIKKVAKQLFKKHYFYTFQGRADDGTSIFGDGMAHAPFWESVEDVRNFVVADLKQRSPKHNPCLTRFERIK